jgi:hypothetical protein
MAGTEILFARDAPDLPRRVKAGSVRKLASRLYTTNLADAPEDIVRRNVWSIAAGYMPGALVADRTAIELRPAPDGSLFVVSDHKRDIRLPGVTLRPRKGPPPLDRDQPFIGGLHLSCPARAFLDNFRSSRARSGVARTLPAREIEDRLEGMLRSGGTAAVQKLRDQARAIAAPLGLEREFQKLDSTIGAMLGTRSAKLSSPLAIARSQSRGYDPDRLDLFERLRAELVATPPVSRLANPDSGPALPFFEAYFSNFIEGTEFAVDEAAGIVFEGKVPTSRPQDAHDVFGTWTVVSDPHEMSRVPRTYEEFAALLRSRHAQVMGGRPDKSPGRFKSEPNRAGSTLFVAPDLLEGTLARGFEIHRTLSSPLHRAVFMGFLVAEVHPFSDGNGRASRIMMNAELVAEGECRIIIPTVFRNNYLMALRALSQNRRAGPLVRSLDFAQRYTVAIDFSDLDGARRMLDATNAFLDPLEADATGAHLRMPAAEPAG